MEGAQSLVTETTFPCLMPYDTKPSCDEEFYNLFTCRKIVLTVYTLDCL